MEAFDLTKEYGLVLEGGGAKGAYQIGVWKALAEYGVKITGVSGVSAGALNGALICMGDLQKAIDIWENISYSKVMNVNMEQMEKLMQGDRKDIDLAELTRESAKLLMDRGLDVAPLKHWIEELIDEEKIRNSKIEFFLGTFSLTRFKELELDARTVKPGLLTDFLLASSYFPAFKNERLHGEKFIDGGLVNNVPIDMLIKRGYENIIVVRIFGPGYEKKTKIPDNVSVIEIAPRVNLGRVLKFDGKRSQKNIVIGYYDGMKKIRNLCGKLYYLESDYNEEYYLRQLLQLPDAIYMPDGNDTIIHAQSLRNILETELPLRAKTLKLKKGWTYKELYLTLLESAAGKLRINRYHVYSDQELLELICERTGQVRSKE